MHETNGGRNEPNTKMGLYLEVLSHAHSRHPFHSKMLQATISERTHYKTNSLVNDENKKQKTKKSRSKKQIPHRIPIIIIIYEHNVYLLFLCSIKHQASTRTPPSLPQTFCIVVYIVIVKYIDFLIEK